MSTKREKRAISSGTHLQLFSTTTATTPAVRRHPKRYCDLRSASQLITHSRATTTTTITSTSQAAYNRRTSRAPAFTVYCDPDMSDAPTRSSVSGQPPSSKAITTTTRTLSLTARPDMRRSPMVADKENTIPEFENILIRPKPLQARLNLKSTGLMLSEKKVESGFFVEKDQVRWGGKKPFEACSPPAQGRSKLRRGLEGKVARESLLQASVYRPSRPIADDDEEAEEARRQERMKEVTSLVAQLEVIETQDFREEEDDDEEEMQDPLPVDAVCPGAPKPVATITLPKFECGDEDEEETAEDVMVESKYPRRSHQMSPLAEVTEAYTGLQGGWSPPLESWSAAVMGDQVSNMLPSLLQEEEKDSETPAVFKLDRFAPRLKRRREVLLGIETASKGPMRI
ncbi:hypothetical protein CROQUDRAFT_721381 [Cronartium quercuum f. sp. fusiforme G11]|uniref:Uncharacterized protein n=1 Tax=Cronartium quercuum f. sp. fusiforme G11 TaxID=708437 RepID=A0A9P6NSU1_9BASI|nr:hypothetical protein CROQUDRAFT_721381 [Cronartium quercuum f. sp. fusiforme G11]